MPSLDPKRLVAEISVQHGIRIDPDDPIMAVVTLNRLVLEQAVAEIVEQVRAATCEFQQAADKVQIRAGAILAQEVRDCIAGIRHELSKGLDAPELRARKRTTEPHSTNSNAAKRWIALGLLLSVLLFGLGVWVGSALR